MSPDHRSFSFPNLRIPVDGLKEAQGEGVALDGNMLSFCRAKETVEPRRQILGLAWRGWSIRA